MKNLLILSALSLTLIGCTTYKQIPTPTTSTTTYSSSAPVVPAATVRTTSTSYHQ